MPISEAQLKVLNEAEQAAGTCASRAVQCERAGLSVLAREYEYMAKHLTKVVEWQKRALAIEDCDAADAAKREAEHDQG